MTRKRVSVKGKGLNLFTPGKPERTDEPEAKPKRATFYMQTDILTWLDNAWLFERSTGHGALSKSEMVNEAMQEYLKKRYSRIRRPKETEWQRSEEEAVGE